MAEFYLTLIETGANQSYIFGSNRLREVVGASELLYRIGTYWVVEAVRGLDSAKGILGSPYSADRLKAHILNEDGLNSPIENAAEGDPGAVEIVIATSGKALLLTRDEECARDIVTRVTRKALEEAPGVSVLGAIVQVDGHSAGALHEAVKRVHERHQALRGRLPGPEARFPRLPMLDECSSTGLPASEIDAKAPEANMSRMSPLTAAKRDKKLRRQGWARIKQALGDDGAKLLLSGADELDNLNLNWHAVVHADGNGVGKIFLNFIDYAPKVLEHGAEKTFRNYISDYREFSLALDACTVNAVKAAINAAWQGLIDKETEKGREGLRAPVVPLVLGGDDLTVACEGGMAVRFAAAFVKEFEKQTADASIVSAVAKNTPEGGDFGRLSASAGVAVVKPHFPFHRAYELCDDLTQSAKKVKDYVKAAAQTGGKEKVIPCSSLDFHVLFDSSGADLAVIRDRLVVEEGEEKPTLYAGPYVTSRLPEGAAGGVGREWVENRGWDDLAGAVEALRKGNAEGLQREGEAEAETGKESLPRSQQHFLREGLYLGPTLADRRVQTIEHRYKFPWKTLTFDSRSPLTKDETESGHRSKAKSLFFYDCELKKGGGETKVRRARLLDAMALADIEAQAKVVPDRRDKSDDEATSDAGGVGVAP